MPVRRPSSARFTLDSENLAPCSARISSSASATAGLNVVSTVLLSMRSPFRRELASLSLTGDSWIGDFNPTEIGVFKATVCG